MLITWPIQLLLKRYVILSQFNHLNPIRLGVRFYCSKGILYYKLKISFMSNVDNSLHRATIFQHVTLDQFESFIHISSTTLPPWWLLWSIWPLEWMAHKNAHTSLRDILLVRFRRIFFFFFLIWAEFDGKWLDNRTHLILG